MRSKGQGIRLAAITLAVPVAMIMPALAGPATGSAEAAEIATPNFYKTPVSSKAGGKRTRGRSLVAETRSGALAQYLVVDRATVDGVEWIGVRPPWRGNRAVAWARAGRFEVSRARARLVLRLRTRVLSLVVNDRPRWRTRVIIGKPSTPTPRGLFALYDRYRVRNDFRPWILELTAHSEKLRRFQGGPARVAFHGMHGSLAAPLGSARSNGCIRVPDGKLRSIRRSAALGTPVLIK